MKIFAVRVPPPQPKLTARQRDLASFIHRYRVRHETGPGTETMAKAMGVHVASLREMLKRLERKGFIRWERRAPGGVWLLKPIPAPAEGFGPWTRERRMERALAAASVTS